MMESNKHRALHFIVLAIIFGCLAVATPAFAVKAQVLYPFYGPNETVTNPVDLISDGAGNFYFADTNDNTVYKMVHDANGSWTEETLHTFNSGAGGLAVDATGNLYGVTSFDGSYGYGSVFELSPGSGGWTETDLYSFNPENGSDGWYPSAVVLDGKGNIYGTTYYGGVFQDPYCNGFGCGTIFKLTHNPDSSWSETILYAPLFIDGAYPVSAPVLDAAGNVYGAGSEGGPSNCLSRDGGQLGCGTIFQLSPQQDGSWTFNRIHSFQGSDGAEINAPFIIDKSGNIYGTAYHGGGNVFPICGNYFALTDCGLAFELSPQPNGQWTQTILYTFGNSPTDVLQGNISGMDAGGNLFGYGGNGAYGLGTFWKVKPNKKGPWKEDILYSYGGFWDDVIFPEGIVVGTDGYVYGLGAIMVWPNRAAALYEFKIKP
ncbi:MAG: choice-of-anchor tandem repeat GloVer-containing protein [Terriglobales bacterium]